MKTTHQAVVGALKAAGVVFSKVARDKDGRKRLRDGYSVLVLKHGIAVGYWTSGPDHDAKIAKAVDVLRAAGMTVAEPARSGMSAVVS